MGLLGKLFDKKVCCICGGEIGLLGNKKLEDGDLCKHCAERLSPFFSDRRHSTVAEIAAQLQYRDMNRMRVAEFRVTRSYGKILIDDNMQAFMVTTATNLMAANPDVIGFAQVTSCQPNIRESRSEVRGKGPDGHSVSFNPPRFHYSYDFGVKLYIQSPYFDEIYVDLAMFNIDEENRSELYRMTVMTEDVCESLTGIRPDLSMAIPPQQAPFCHRCGADLLPNGTCPICDRPQRPAPAPIPLAVPPMGRPGGAPQGRPAPAPQQPTGGPQHRPAAPAQEPQRPVGGPQHRPAAPVQEPQRQAGGPQHRPAAPAQEPQRQAGGPQHRQAAPTQQPQRPAGAPQQHQAAQSQRPTGAPQQHQTAPQQGAGRTQPGAGRTQSTGAQAPGRQNEPHNGPQGPNRGPQGRPPRG